MFNSIYAMSQESKMKKIDFEKISCYIINKKEKDSLLKNNNGILDKNLSDTEKMLEAYKLNDGKYVYDMVDIQTFMFNSADDLKFFLKRTTEIAIKSTKSQIDIKDENLLEKKDLYINLFLENYEIELDFEKLDHLKKIDILFRDNKIENITPKYNYSLTLIVGEFLNYNITDFSWSKLIIDNRNSTFKYILLKNNQMLEPAVILESIINKKMEDRNSDDFFETLNDIVNYYR